MYSSLLIHIFTLLYHRNNPAVSEFDKIRCLCDRSDVIFIIQLSIIIGLIIIIKSGCFCLLQEHFHIFFGGETLIVFTVSFLSAEEVRTSLSGAMRFYIYKYFSYLCCIFNLSFHFFSYSFTLFVWYYFQTYLFLTVFYPHI